MSMGMSGPGWLADIFAAIMLLVALSSALRLLVAWRRSRYVHLEVEIDHLFMGVAMAGMFVASLNPLPAPIWEAIFSVVAAWFLWRCAALVVGRPMRATGPHAHHVAHYPTHLVMALAMLYMYFASGSGATAMGAATGTTTDFLGLPLLFLFVLLASAIWELDRAGRLRHAQPSPAPSPVPEYARVGSDASATGTHPEDSAAVPSTVPVSDDSSLLAPGLMAAAHVAMCVAMGYMLIVML